jgi:hypothetical protein
MGLFDGGDSSGGIMGMLSGMFGGGNSGITPDPTAGAPLNIQSQAQQDGTAAPSFLDQLKAGLAKNPQALSGLAMQVAGQNKPGAVPPLQPLNIPQAPRPQAYGSLMPRIGQ